MANRNNEPEYQSITAANTCSSPVCNARTSPGSSSLSVSCTVSGDGEMDDPPGNRDTPTTDQGIILGSGVTIKGFVQRTLGDQCRSSLTDTKSHLNNDRQVLHMEVQRVVVEPKKKGRRDNRHTTSCARSPGRFGRECPFEWSFSFFSEDGERVLSPYVR